MDLFLSNRLSWDLTLGVAHVNHGLRGKMADKDELFVRDLVHRNGLPFYHKKEDVRTYAMKNKISIEEGAREVRYKFLYALLDRLNYDRLALGHHANDQAETILMNLVRGSGLRGMGGMRPTRDRVIRPLLFVSRGTVESYAVERSLDFVEDASNRDRKFLRNRIRWDVIPVLENASGHQVVSPICRTGDACQEAEGYLKYSAREAREKKQAAMAHTAVRRHLL